MTAAPNPSSCADFACSLIGLEAPSRDADRLADMLLKARESRVDVGEALLSSWTRGATASYTADVESVRSAALAVGVDTWSDPLPSGFLGHAVGSGGRVEQASGFNPATAELAALFILIR